MSPYPKGTRVEKINSEPGDGHRDGACATVVDNLDPSSTEAERQELLAKTGDSYGYFVEWDDLPGLPVFVNGSRVREVLR